MSLGKNLGKLKQWTSEKIGSAEKTDTSEDFKQLEFETDQRRDSLEKLENTLDVYLKALSKRKPTADDKGKTMPIEALGTCMVNQAYVLGEDGPYGKALLKAGQAHEKIAVCQGDFVNNARGGYYANLDRSLTDMKDYNNLRKKLENRRLDLDAKLSRVQKAKREKPELEEELRAAQVKYDDTLSDVKARMVIIAEAEDYHVRDLAMFIEAELTLYKKAVEILTPILDAVKEIANTPKPKKYLPSNVGNGSASLGRSLTYSESRRRLDYESEEGSPHSTGSYDDFEARPVPRSSGPSSTRSKTADKSGPPPVPRRSVPKKQVRCVYEFDPADEDELPMSIGDLITVIKEVDEGWWVGEIIRGHSKRSGMFPVNYTEPVKNSTPSQSFDDNEAWVLPDDSYNLTPQNNSRQYADPEEVGDFEVDSPPPPTYRRVNTATSSSSSHSLRGSNPPFSGTHSNNGSRSPSGSSNRDSAPPRPSGPKPNAVSNPASNRANRSGPRAPHLRPSGDAAASMAAAVTNNDVSSSNIAECRECGCDDFNPNVFKKGACNNCFHKH